VTDLLAVPATPGHWLDTDSPLSDATLAALVSAGIVGVFRYVPLPGNNPLMDISPAELERICAHGLQCSLVQHVRGPGLWRPADHDGAADARTAAGHALGCGFPAGCDIAQDLEACSGTDHDSIDYCNVWGEAMKAAGFLPRLYVGYSTNMTPKQLHDDVPHASYWSDAGHREVATRGVDTQQGSTISIGGISFDTDLVAPDLVGGLFVACGRAPAVVA
jgi:glycoside hydrolase-like protein